ncbi:hypothetical protein AJ79_00945 [Helicocarpus griseus UAMH5409]|uniref:Enoyl reductase (ER) domain-containing protein n=1 Tax=Helicocarpus griseus UAMH5409 TaxID=1447875 RepID=A0A2B7Y158_9EURO|nr:hypothetical protein AJ79_00945 [Helicocarpus griseus UAMH5409]
MCTTTTPELASVMPKGYLDSHVIHPVTLDIMFVAGLVAIWTDFRCYGKVSREAYDSFSFDIKCSDGSNDQPRVSFAGIRFTPLSDEDASLSGTKQLGYSMDWTLDINMLRTPEFRDSVSVEPSTSYDEQQNLFEKLQLASALLITDALDALKDTPVTLPEGHLQKYYEWMHRIADDVKANSASHASLDTWTKYNEDAALKQELYQNVENLNKDGELMIRLGVRIPDIMRGEVDPLYLMFGQDDIMTSYYQEVLHEGDATENLDAYLSLLGENYSDLEILEVGAGTGSFARLLLSILAPRGENEKNLGEWSDLLTYEKLDVERDPTTQGFTAKKYDLIIAHDVLHATPHLGKSLENTQRLLKSGGNSSAKWLALISYGLHLSSVYSLGGGCPTSPIANGIHLSPFLNGMTSFVKLSTMISTALPDPSDKNTSGNDVVILSPPSGVDPDFISGFKAELTEKAGATNCTVMRLDEIEGKDNKNTICVSLLELRNSMLLNISEDTFKHLQQFFSTCRRLLWVTGDPIAKPAFNMSTGMIRTLRWERDAESPNFVTLALGGSSSSFTKTVIDTTSKVFQYQFTSGQTKHHNAEYFLRNGLIHINHVLSHPKATGFLRSQFSALSPEMTPWEQIGRPVKLQNSARGSLNKLQWIGDDSAAPPLRDWDVEVDVRAVGLNFVDLLSIMGEGIGNVIGREAAGVVTRVGNGVKNLQPGDRVAYLTDSPKKGTFQSHGRVNELLAIKIPDDMSFGFAAGLPVIYATVIYSLTNAAIQYAQEIGTEIFATVSTVEKREFLQKEYGIAEDHIFSSRDTSFVHGIMRMTGNTGVDLVLNSLSQESLRRSFECVAPFGRFIEIGKKGLQAGGKLDMTPFLQNITFTGVDLLTLAEAKPKVVRDLLETTMRLWTEKKIKRAYPLTVLGYSEMEDGLRMLQSGKNMGKIVFAPNEKDVVPVIPEVQTPYQFDPNASYVLAAGLGGLGRRRTTEPVEEMISTLESKGCKAQIFTCDVSDLSRLQAVVKECEQTLPPIKGVFRDSLFENLSYADWTATIKPEAQGSQNLHEVLPKDLDFFVMLSSLAGVMGG